MSSQGYGLSFIALAYILSISIYILKAPRALNRGRWVGLILMWLLPPIYWYKYMRNLLRDKIGLHMALCIIIVSGASSTSIQAG